MMGLQYLVCTAMRFIELGNILILRLFDNNRVKWQITIATWQ